MSYGQDYSSCYKQIPIQCFAAPCPSKTIVDQDCINRIMQSNQPVTWWRRWWSPPPVNVVQNVLPAENQSAVPSWIYYVAGAIGLIWLGSHLTKH